MLSERGRRFRWTLLRIAVSVILLTFLLLRITLADLGESFARALVNWPLLLAALALPVVGLVLAALRWQQLMDVQGIHIPVRRYMGAMLVGAFFNQTLPSTVGGDLARGVWVTDPGESPIANLAVVTLDRAIGVFSLCLLALICAFTSPAVRELVPMLWLVPGSLALMAGLLALLATRHAPTLGDRIFSRGPLQRYRDKAILVFDTLRAYRDQKVTLVWAVVLSFGLQLVIVIQTVLFASALDLDLPMWELALIVPVVTLVSMVPVTVNGLGLREGTYAVLGASIGLGPADAIALGWLTVATAVGYGVCGALLHLRGRDRREPVEESS